MIYIIRPYVSKWDGVRVWVFDDPSKGLINEGLVSGSDKILDMLSAHFERGEDGFTLVFSDIGFMRKDLPGEVSLEFEWVRSGTGEGLAEGVEGNWYKETQTGWEGWLCPALFKYFDTAPKQIHVRASALEGKLEKGTGKVIIQGKKD